MAFGSGNDQRVRLFQGLTKFMQIAKSFGLFKTAVLDGSFVTDKAVPGDIDVVLEMERDALPKLLARPDRDDVMHHDYIKVFYEVDLYLSAMSPGMVAFFQRVRTSEAIVRKLGPGASKGVVRITI